MLVKCPNCGYEFAIGDDEIVGICPRCHIKLAFKRGNEIIEKVDIRKIEEEIDRIPTISKKGIDIEEIEEKENIEEKIDEIIG